jgi:hypothetical protein
MAPHEEQVERGRVDETTEASLSDERDVELALHDDREGIGAAATAIDGRTHSSSPENRPRRG